MARAGLKNLICLSGVLIFRRNTMQDAGTVASGLSLVGKEMQTLAPYGNTSLFTAQ